MNTYRIKCGHQHKKLEVSMFFKHKELQATLESIESKLNTIIAMLKAEKIKNASKKAKEVKE